MTERRKLSEVGWDAVRDEMRAIMIETARARETITYSELARRLRSAHVHYHSSQFNRLLNEIGRDELIAGRPPLPAVVVLKSTGIPGGGYFAGPALTGAAVDDLEARWREDAQAVWDYWAG